MKKESNIVIKIKEAIKLLKQLKTSKSKKISKTGLNSLENHYDETKNSLENFDKKNFVEYIEEFDIDNLENKYPIPSNLTPREIDALKEYTGPKYKGIKPI
ncbi:MAG: hypothetical protein LBR24_04205 [Methanobrevibacter sp.]|jgi:hypothetical protein|nr:hypothetical protein [Methanobrevibacter sp.]